MQLPAFLTDTLARDSLRAEIRALSWCDSIATSCRFYAKCNCARGNDKDAVCTMRRAHLKSCHVILRSCSRRSLKRQNHFYCCNYVTEGTERLACACGEEIGVCFIIALWNSFKKTPIGKGKSLYQMNFCYSLWYSYKNHVPLQLNRFFGLIVISLSHCHCKLHLREQSHLLRYEAVN